MQSCWSHPVFRVRRAFSLTELLIVIGIIVVILAMAVPAFNALTGSRSIESATNLISANLSRARLAAIQAQQPRGLVFYRDANTDRVAMALAGLRTADNSLDVIPNTDVQYFPPGVSIAFRHSMSGNSYVYRLHNPASPDLYGLILFDSRGHVMHHSYGIYQNDELGRRLGLTSNASTFGGENLYSQPAFLLFEQAAFDNVPTEADQRDWLNNNASVLLVNRYNGTLTRSE